MPRVDAGDWAAEKREKLARAEALRAQRKADAAERAAREASHRQREEDEWRRVEEARGGGGRAPVPSPPSNPADEESVERQFVLRKHTSEDGERRGSGLRSSSKGGNL